MLTRDDLHPYQRAAIAWMADNPEGMIWLGLGDGKTVIAATWIADRGDRAVVFGTKRIIEEAWPAELAKWEHLRGLSYAACSGPEAKRWKAINSKPDILGVSYENLHWYYTTSHDSGRSGLVMDEISKMKAANTRRFKTFKAYRSRYDNLYGLTATPAAESYVGLYGQYRSIVTEPVLGRTLTEFRNAYTSQHFKGMFTEYRVGPLQKRAIEAAISRYTFVIPEPERFKREEPTVIDVSVPFSKKNLAAYRQMEKKLILELSEQKTPIQAASKGVMFNKCRQLACGFVYDEGTPHDFDHAKWDAIAEEYEALGGEPVLIAYQFVYEKEELLRRLPGSEPLEGDAYTRFNEGKIPALIVNPKSCGHGLNLQGSCRHIFWASLPWGLEDYLQTNGRIDRQGQAHQVIIKRFIRSASIDEIILDRLAGKVTNMAELIQMMRERL